MDRRTFALGVGGALAALIGSAHAQTQPDAFEQELKALADDVDALDAANGLREKYQPIPGEPFGVQSASRRRKSTSSISSKARDLIVTCEISSQQRYEKRYQHPIWPGGRSGVTIGIGYDLGYFKADAVQGDWAGILDAATLALLNPVCGVHGVDAKALLASVNAATITWTQASAQFDAFLPYAIGEVEDTFPNCADLSGDCLGALTSLVYNRGSSLSPTSDRRREMREVFRFMRDRKFDQVPAKIREMKRLWINDPSARGVVARRELEALLFERGLRTV